MFIVCSSLLRIKFVGLKTLFLADMFLSTSPLLNCFDLLEDTLPCASVWQCGQRFGGWMGNVVASYAHGHRFESRCGLSMCPHPMFLQVSSYCGICKQPEDLAKVNWLLYMTLCAFIVPWDPNIDWHTIQGKPWESLQDFLNWITSYGKWMENFINHFVIGTFYFTPDRVAACIQKHITKIVHPGYMMSYILTHRFI